MSDDDRKWPGYRQDREDERKQAERQREEQIKADNLSSRIRSQFRPGDIDPATGRTFGDGRARGMYDDEKRLRDLREMNDRNRREQADTRRRLGRQDAFGRAGRQAMTRDLRDHPSGQPPGRVPARPEPDRGGPLGRADTLGRAARQALERDRQRERQPR